MLAQRQVRATFFFTVGPDNMGRHLWRLVRPAFLYKMLRTRAMSLYGWDMWLRGTLGPGPLIGRKLGHVIVATEQAGHEIGLHCWDHYQWQTHMDEASADTLRQWCGKGVRELTRILGHHPRCSAVPGWKCHGRALEVKAEFVFDFNSDCRGQSCFWPRVHGRALPQVQIPVTLPTYDEMIGRNGVNDANYNRTLLDLLRPNQLNVLAIHAEVEGISKKELFAQFLQETQARGVTLVPLGDLFQRYPPIEHGVLRSAEIDGRDGWVAQQCPARLD
jgi:undecaprenyl phosphate-alpha-L-ara4FN deformylase